MAEACFVVIKSASVDASKKNRTNRFTANGATPVAGKGVIEQGAIEGANQDAIHGSLSIGIVLLSFALIAFTRVDTFWIMLGAAGIGLLAFQF